MVALHVPKIAEGSKRIRLLAGFNAFRNDVQAQCARERVDGGHEGKGVFVHRISRSHRLSATVIGNDSP